MTDLFIVILTSILNILLASVVLLRNPKAPVNRIFACLSGSLVTWTFFNFLADQAPNYNLLFTRLTFVGAVFIALSVYQLSNIFPLGKPINSFRTQLLQLIIGINIGLISLTSLLVPSVKKHTEGAGVELSVGPLYYLYVAFIFYILIFSVINFRRNYKKANVTEKAQIKFLIWGIVLYALFASGSNLILPIFIDSWSSSRIGPIFTLLFIAMTAYAIIKHKLLDIRLIIARSIAYTLLLVTLVAIYGALVFTASNTFTTSPVPYNRQWLYILSAIFIAITYQPLKRFFNRVTNKFFYRDAYDAQNFIDELNKILVSNIEISKLLEQTSQLIEQNLKSTFVTFGIKESSQIPQRIIGTGRKEFNTEDIDLARKLTPLVAKKVIIPEDLDESHHELKDLLSKNNIAILVRLTPETHSKKEGIGYIVIGYKKSGNPYNNQDLKILGIITNELVIAIQNALRFEEIQQFNITLQQKVDEATKQLRSANEKLKALDETKDEFISMASHQLRTPLTTVKGYLSMVLEGDTGKVPSNQRKLLDQSFISAQRMVYLIADLLNVSRLKTGKFVIDSTPTNLADVVEGEISQLIQSAKDRDLELTYKKPKDFPTLMLDETKIRQVIMNFADNAIYYTPSGGHIQVKLAETPESVEFTVVDDGIGVPKTEQHHMFSKFYRAGNAKKARPDGTGLGLFMAKKVVVAQGGAIIFKSEEGKGSTFGFSFSKEKLKVPAHIKPIKSTAKKEPSLT